MADADPSSEPSESSEASGSDDGVDSVDASVDAADVANGEPAATDPHAGPHRTGEEQARKNREDDPPA